MPRNRAATSSALRALDDCKHLLSFQWCPSWQESHYILLNTEWDLIPKVNYTNYCGDIFCICMFFQFFCIIYPVFSLVNELSITSDGHESSQYGIAQNESCIVIYITETIIQYYFLDHLSLSKYAIILPTYWLPYVCLIQSHFPISQDFYQRILWWVHSKK